ncbi:lantibiotic dehydratase [Asanoa ishikariensis]|uniref:Lantibiotic dehydratase, C terminus n=1 Tax=Asanoa ishikariensis TaxID=137265 RepID=A0A1H3TBE4_9ACTN|nr:lantibiotic dehydratase [Asanoa ishikariensis]GIF62786.1 lantibiotic dehydratase [Asanoa ishikariensis]SDZ47161.1 Lantibiotic dehydratase, C terminus [Asanoa ishikariensis]
MADEQHLTELDRGWALWRLAALRSAGLPIERLDVFAAPEGDDAELLRESRRAAFDALLGDDRFRAALTWQNPEAMDTWAAAHAAELKAGRRPRVSGHRFGNRMAVVTRYAQRYCAKNDTIGFFGPVAWARLGGAHSGHTGGGGIRHSQVYVEVWAVQSIAAAWSADPALRDHLPVRLDPSCTVREGTVVRPYRRPYVLSPDETVVLDALAAGADRVGDLATPAGVLDGLRDAGVVQVGFRVPISSHPLDGLAEQLAGPQRADRLRRIACVREACAAVAVATDPEELRAALADAARVLDDAAGAPVRREAAFTVGGRTPLYLDCRRDLDGTIGDDLLADLARPLGVLLDSARWLCGQVADVAEEALAARFRALAATRAEVTLAELYLAAADLLEPGGGGFAEVVTDFQLRWAEIIGSGGDGPVLVDAGLARRLADALFPAPRRTWAAARLHSPDMLLRRRPDGSLAWVLGELHVALNTLESRFFSAQADDAGELVAAMATDMAPGRVVPLYPSTARDVSSRSYPPLSLDPAGHYRYVSFGSDDGHPAGVPGTPATAITVAMRAGVLVATSTRDGWEAPVLECFGEHLSSVAVNLFKLRAPAVRAPRVAIGAVTVCRESWRVPLAHLADMAGRDKDPGQNGLRSWLAGLGLPRHVFARVPGDPKPFFVDLQAPPLADNLARAARRAMGRAPAGAEVDLVEMLPAPDELWLRLPDGSYTSELRLVAVDPQPARAVSWSLAEAAGRAR